MQLVLASFDVLKAEDIIGKTITTVENGIETYYTVRAEDLNDRGAEDDWHKYIEVKPVEELEDLTNMHKVYHDKDKLNGNGFLDELMASVNRLEKRAF